MSDLRDLSTKSVNLAVRTISCIKGITNADGDNDALTQQSMALSFATDLGKVVQELDKHLIKIGACKVSDGGNESKMLEVDCMLGQINSILSCLLEDITDSDMAGLIGGAITITNTAQETLKS